MKIILLEARPKNLIKSCLLVSDVIYTCTCLLFDEVLKVIDGQIHFKLVWIFFVSHNVFTFLATRLVTAFEEFKRFNNSIQAFWKQTLHPAMRLEIVATCKYDCDNGRVYFVNTTVLVPNATSFTFTGLEPGSLCEFTLKAVFNPASLDKGISVTYMVLPASKMLCMLNIHNFIYKIVMRITCNNFTLCVLLWIEHVHTLSSYWLI